MTIPFGACTRAERSCVHVDAHASALERPVTTDAGRIHGHPSRRCSLPPPTLARASRDTSPLAPSKPGELPSATQTYEQSVRSMRSPFERSSSKILRPDATVGRCRGAASLIARENSSTGAETSARFAHSVRGCCASPRSRAVRAEASSGESHDTPRQGTCRCSVRTRVKRSAPLPGTRTTGFLERARRLSDEHDPRSHGAVGREHREGFA